MIIFNYNSREEEIWESEDEKSIVIDRRCREQRNEHALPLSVDQIAADFS